MIAAPGIVCRMNEELNISEISPGFIQMLGCFFTHDFVCHIDVNCFTLRNTLDKFGIARING